MENFKLKNKFMYGSHIILLWFLCGLLFYCFLILVTQAPQEDSNFLSHYLFYILIAIATSWIYGRIYYSLRNDILQIRTPYLVLKTLVLQDIIKADYYASAKLHFLHGWYNVCLTDQKGKKYYLYVKNEKRFIELLKEKNPTLSVVM